jgi:DUF1365 family protein
MMLDLDEIETLSSRLTMFSFNRFNLISFYTVDHGNFSEKPLRDQINERLEEAGLGAAGKKIFLLCMPRVLGYGFNPLSVFFCYDEDRKLGAIVYEVHNTFGERHSYVMPCHGDHAAIEQECGKEFYVSPFLGMDMSYAFRVRPPTDRVQIAIQGKDKNGTLITAVLSGGREDLSDAALTGAFFGHPLLTVKIVAAIHWHAFRMILKGFRWHPKY